ncbi:MAG TPA: helix-turn-helix transcriptional regulator [Caulobacterales bacterium]|nr:helix-turn-helix transcriptional regulator [Caulobacterales bacterium]
MLAAKREAAGLTQRDVAKALGWRQSVIARIELHDRRLDVIELVQLASVIGLDPAKLIRELRALMIKRGDVTD